MRGMTLRITTWNINSVRLRIDQVERFLNEHQPDVLCLQEIKCQAHEFPHKAFQALGYDHIKVAGQKGWHGVATVSKVPLGDGTDLKTCRREEARYVSTKVLGPTGALEIWNLYIPAGGDEPDRATNDKFDHKLDFYERLTKCAAEQVDKGPLLITGDLNIAPGEFDVWSHKQMLKVVSHTPIELETFATLMADGALTDLVRAHIPDPQKLFSWWSYRATDFRASNRGLRLDHHLANPALAKIAQETGHKVTVHDDVRAWEKPSDHAPVTLDLEGL